MYARRRKASYVCRRTFAAIGALLLVALPLGPAQVVADNGYKLPYTAGQSWIITQGWYNDPSSGVLDHTGTQKYAYDFGMPDGTPVLAPKGGTVTAAVGNNPADACRPDKTFVKFYNL